MLYEIREGSVSLSGDLILNRVEFQIKDKEKIALVGSNGAGKTTLLRLIGGDLSPDRDDHLQRPPIWTAENIRMGSLSQNPFSGHDQLSRTVEDEIDLVCQGTEAWSRERFDLEQEYHRAFTAMGFSLADQEKKLGSFSGGERMKIALIRLLMEEPDLLLLDEPTNHLDVDGVEWLEDKVRNYPGAVVMVSHDRYFLDRTADLVYELEGGKLTRYGGNYTAYRKEKAAVAERARKEYRNQQEEIRRLKDLIERFKHKPKKAAMARSKKKYLERMTLVEKPPEKDPSLFRDPIEPRLKGSKLVLEAREAGIGYNKDHPLFQLDFSLRRGRKTGILGENGAGKTTLLKTISGELSPTSGSVRTGQNVELAYFSQHASGELTTGPEKDLHVLEYFRKHFPLMTDKDLRSLLGRYLFTGEDVWKFLRDLSGGEASRLVLARLLESRPNLLLLDEPTNHMDIPAREAIEAALKAYQGTLLFISHDRYFVRELADSLLMIDKGNVTYYPFGYDHYRDRMSKKSFDQEGMDPVEAENSRLLDSFHSVPKKERHQAARLSTDQAYVDWQLNLAAKKIRETRKEVEDRWERLEDWRPYEEAYTKACLTWYDTWIEYEHAFAGYDGMTFDD